MKKQKMRDECIVQHMGIGEELANFLGIKEKLEIVNKPWIIRFLRFVSRPFRFFLRIIVSFSKWLWKMVVHAFCVTFLIPENRVVAEQDSYNVLLVKGDWGTGKTYLVNDFFESNEEASLKYKPVFIDLFGLSSIDELNKKIIESVSYSKKESKEKSIKLYAKATLDNKFTGLSASFEIGIILSKKIERVRTINEFVQKENSYYKHHKYRYIREPVIILDDIERKDKKLSLQSIIGFVDIFKKKGIKVILIANSRQLELEEKEMYHLLDRAVDKTVYLYDIKSSIHLFIDYFQKTTGDCKIYLPKNKAQLYIRNDLTTNLRTIKRFCEFLRKYQKNDYTYADRTFLNIALLCLICQCEGRYDYEELLKKQALVRYNFSISQPPSKSYNEIYEETNNSFSNIKNDKFAIFYEITKDLIKEFDVFADDREQRSVVELIYDCIETDAIVALSNTKIILSNCGLRNSYETNVFPSSVDIEGPINKFEEKINEFVKMLNNEDESKFYLLFNYANYVHFSMHTSRVIDLVSAKKIVAKTCEKFVKAAVDEFLKYGWRYDFSLSTPQNSNEVDEKYSIYYFASLFENQIADYVNKKYLVYGLRKTVTLIESMSRMSEWSYFFSDCLGKIDDDVLYCLCISSDKVLIKQLIQASSFSVVFCDKILPIFEKALVDNALTRSVEIALKQSYLKLDKKVIAKKIKQQK